MIAFLMRLEARARTVVNSWWRPAAALTLVGSLFVNGIWLPVVTLKSPELAQLAALVSAIVVAMGVREVGKRWGTSQ